MSRVVLVVNIVDEPSETFQRALAVLLAEAGHDVVLLGLRGAGHPDEVLHPRVTYAGPIPRAADLGVVAGHVLRHRRFSAEVLRRAVARWGRGRRSLAAALGAVRFAAFRPDVVHFGFSSIGAAWADVFEVWDDVPVVVSCRGSDELVRPLLHPEHRGELVKTFARAAVVHCVADAVASAAIELGALPSKVRVVRPAVDVERWPIRLGPAPGPPWRLVTTTRLTPAKGVDDLLAAVAMVCDGGHDVMLEVLGGGPWLDDLRLRAARAGISDRVDFVGVVDPPTVGRHLERGHLYVSPSLSEGISNGVLEAMATGVPVVSTEVGGMAEVIVDGIDGWLVPPARPDRLAAAIAAALSGPDALAAVGAAGRAKVDGSYNSAGQAAAWRDLYAEVLGDLVP